MSFVFRSLLLVALVLGAGGCLPSSEGQSDDQKDPYFQTGKSREMDRDFKGAIEAFEKALEANPRSALAHFELGVLYEQQENDYAAALYHYDRCVKLRPNEHPADNASGRIEICKRELAKSVAQIPSMEKMQRELDRLTLENQQLRQNLEQWKAATGRGHAAPDQSAAGAPHPWRNFQRPRRHGGHGSHEQPGRLRHPAVRGPHPQSRGARHVRRHLAALWHQAHRTARCSAAPPRTRCLCRR